MSHSVGHTRSGRATGPERLLCMSHGLFYYTCFIASSTSIILIKKKVLTQQHCHFPYLFILIGMLIGTVAIRSGAALGIFTVRAEKRAMMTRGFCFRFIWPVAITSALAIAFGAACYVHLSISFVQMLKGMTPVLTMVVLWALRMEPFSCAVLIAIAVLAAGTAATAVGELNADAIGVTLFAISAVAEVARIVLTQYLMQNVDLSAIEAMYFINPVQCLTIFVTCVFTEGAELLRPVPLSARDALLVAHDPDPAALGWSSAMWGAAPLETQARAVATTLHRSNLIHFIALQWQWLALFGVCSFTISFAAFGAIKVTSSLTLKLAVIARGVLLVVIGVVIFAEAVMPLQRWGYAMSCVAFFLYSRAKLQKGNGVPLPLATEEASKGAYGEVRQVGLSMEGQSRASDESQLGSDIEMPRVAAAIGSKSEVGGGDEEEEDAKGENANLLDLRHELDPLDIAETRRESVMLRQEILCVDRALEKLRQKVQGTI